MTRVFLILVLLLSPVACAAPATRPATTQASQYIQIQGRIGDGEHDILTVLVDVTNAPDVRDWAIKAAHYAIDVYPRIVAQLPSAGFEAPKIVTLYFKVMDGVAYTDDRKITISAQWITAHPDDMGLVAHELTHVVQQYKHVNKNAGWIVEGMADYVRYYVIEPESAKRKFNANRSSYKNGYQPAAGLLNWIEQTRGPGFIVKLNALLREGKYTSQAFADLAGGTPGDLWTQFKATLPQPATRLSR